MANFKEIFKGKKHVFLPVIHVEDAELALHNVQIAKNNGADGVFLINHRIPWQELLQCYAFVKEKIPDFWIGMNFLDRENYQALHALPKSASGLWIDDGGIREDSRKSNSKAEDFSAVRRFWDWDGLYFGGVAFKYQTPVNDVAKAAKLAMPFIDVITTSGEGTGVAADVSKICTMKKAVGEHPLAIASGITPENVTTFMPYADCFLVATGISFSHTKLDPVRVRELATILGK